MADETIIAKEEGIPEVYSSLLTTTQLHLAQEKLASACCICCEQCNGSKSSKCSTTINYKTKLSDQHQQLRETLQIYLIRIQVEEAMMDDKQTALMQHLSSISNAFEAAIQYMQSLQVSYLAAKRVLDMSQALLAYHPPPSADYASEDFVSCHRQVEIEKEKKMSSLQELMECCSKNIVFPKDVCTLLDDHRNRKKDFFLASANFKSLLENSKLSVSQMEKLQRQHDTILKDFQQSRRLIDTELPKIINLYLFNCKIFEFLMTRYKLCEILKIAVKSIIKYRRLEALQQIFHKIAELYGDVDYNMYAANLFELIAVNMRQVVPNMRKAVFYGQEANKEICQKCKVDRVDKK